jgi:hypothetical protein
MRLTLSARLNSVSTEPGKAEDKTLAKYAQAFAVTPIAFVWVVQVLLRANLCFHHRKVESTLLRLW